MVLRYKNIHAFDNNQNNKHYLQYVQSRWGLRTSSMLRVGYPTLLAWRGRYDLSSLKTSRFYHTLSENGNRVFTHWLILIKMYKFTISGYVPVYVHCIDSQSISYRRSLSLFSSFCLTRQFYQKSWVWVICSDETSNQGKAKSLSNFTLPYSLLICSISACSQHQYLLPWLIFSCVYHLTCRRKEQKKERTVLQ